MDLIEQLKKHLNLPRNCRDFDVMLAINKLTAKITELKEEKAELEKEIAEYRLTYHMGIDNG